MPGIHAVELAVLRGITHGNLMDPDEALRTDSEQLRLQGIAVEALVDILREDLIEER